MQGLRLKWYSLVTYDRYTLTIMTTMNLKKSAKNYNLRISVYVPPSVVAPSQQDQAPSDYQQESVPSVKI